MSDPLVSHGRGGQGNIARDSTKYADAGVVREGIQGESIDGEYSSGRGGAGNVVPSPKVKPTRRGSGDKLPDANLFDTPKGATENYHVGRGGGGNFVGAEKKHDGEGATKEHKESLLDKAKHALHLDKKDKPAA